MPVFVVSYDLHKDQSTEHYDRVAKRITGCGEVLEIQYSVWVLKSEKTAGGVRDEVALDLDQGDKAFVGEIVDWASRTQKRAADFLNA